MQSLFAIVAFALPVSAQSTVVDRTNPGQELKALDNCFQFLGSSSVASDDFNRPDGSDLGPDWTERLGDLAIWSNRATANSSGVSWMTRNGVAAPYFSSIQRLDFMPKPSGTGLIFVGLVVGNEAVSSQNVFVKVQDNNGDGFYDIAFFYKGINGSSWGSAYSFSFPTPTATGRMQLSFSSDGDIAILDIDYNMDDTWDWQFQVPGLLTSGLTLGSSFGISLYNNPTVDNWSVRPHEVGMGYCYADEITTPCPCGNNSNELSGCTNNTGLGAILIGEGLPDVAADSLALYVTQAPSLSPGLFFSAPASTSNTIFGDGFMCVSGTIIRLGVVFTDEAGFAATDFTISEVEELVGGEQRNYQYWYRDLAGPCSTGFNTSNALSVQW